MTVWCAKTQYDWQQHVGEGDANGTAHVETGEVFLSPVVCRSIRLRLDRKPVLLASFGPSLLVLVHEAVHLRGELDEGRTDCAAARAVPAVARRFFRFTTTGPLSSAVAAYRAKQPPEYVAVC